MNAKKMISDCAQELKEKHASIYRDFEMLQEQSPLTVEHCVKTANIVYAIGKELELRQTNLQELVLAALVHDVGKVDVKSEVLTCTRNLTSEEFEEMKEHVRYGFEKLKHLPKKVRRAVLEHHENVDGSGYPKGLIGNSISLYGKILRVADVTDAICSPREYKKALEPKEACAHLIEEKGILFDETVVDAYLASVGMLKEESEC